MPDLVTPTGVLLGTPEPRTDEWFALRRQGITATDLPLILGLVPEKYGNALTVWLDKRGFDVPDSDDEAAMWGVLQEPLVAGVWGDRFGTPVHPVGVLANDAHRWQRASLDRLVEVCPDGDGPCALEIKTRSAFKSRLWRRDVPDDTLAQVLWQIVVSGFMHIHVATLLGGQRMRTFRVDAVGNEAIIELLVEKARELWAAVESGEQPEVDPSEAMERALDVLFPDRTGELELPESRVRDLLRGRTDALDAERAAKKAKAAWRAAVKEALGDRDTITVGGKKIVSIRWHDRAGYTVEPTRYQSVDLVGSLPDLEDVDDVEEDDEG